MVTDGLAAKHKERVRDFPPDETTLVGAGMGMCQAGLVPIVEIPYAKYLDCAADMFHEAIITNWLSNGAQSVGMVVRLQGFDKGVFGGNFHTHNMLHIPPGLDVVCFSNGRDYVRGMRYAARQARGGRLVMSVDSTDLLNRRHLRDTEKDEYFLQQYPAEAEELSFDEISRYKVQRDGSAGDVVVRSDGGDVPRKKVAIVSYGNGVPTSLLAMEILENQGLDVTVVDCPYLSAVPRQLTDLFSGKEVFDAVVFADVCKQGSSMPLSNHSISLHHQRLLPSAWTLIGASPTFNPLSRTLTFLTTEDIVDAVTTLVK